MAAARNKQTVRGLLRLARRDSGLSQRDLAALLGRSQSWVSKVENGPAGIVLRRR